MLMTLTFLGLTWRVLQLQIKPAPAIADRFDSQRSRKTFPGRRGDMMDRHGRVFATSRIAQRLFVDPMLIENPNTFSEHVGYQLGYDPAWIEKKINVKPGRRYVLLDRRLNDERMLKLKTLQLPGLTTEPFLVRDYPQGQVAGQVIGFVGVDDRGLEGLELVLENELSGQTGRMGYVRDARLRPLWVDQAEYVPPRDGDSVVLSFDVTIQSIAEEELRATCEKFQANSGQVLVMDPHTGEILAMANYPPFDPNVFVNSQADDRRNRCVTDVYEPGSTFKPFIWAAAIDAGFVTPNELIDTTTNGVYKTPRGRRLHDVRGHGRITWDDVLVVSSNIGMAIVGQRIKATQMYAMVRSFGFGRSTNSGLLGETAGIVRPPKKWNHYSVTSIPIGQELAVTSLQLLTGFSAIANGGYLVNPTIRLVEKSPDQLSLTTIYERVLSSDVAEHTRRVLRRVVTEGTGHRANSSLYKIFGKTGTAQIADHINGGYLEGQYVSSFLAGAPLEWPRIVVACVINQPDETIGHYGGTVAAPAARRVIEQTLAYLGVKSDIHTFPKAQTPIAYH